MRLKKKSKKLTNYFMIIDDIQNIGKHSYKCTCRVETEFNLTAIFLSFKEEQLRVVLIREAWEHMSAV